MKAGMSKTSRPLAALGLAGLALLGSLGLLAALAPAEVVRVGNLIVSIEGGIAPSKLPKAKPAPISLKVSGSVATADGSHPPALKTLALQFDRHGHIDTQGLPTCTTGKLQSTLTAQAKKVCGKALIGSGRAGAEIAFPEQAPFNASGPLLIFNGVPKGGNPVLIFHVHANVPAPTTFVTSGEISKAHGKYGTSTLIQIPVIVGGQGSLTSFKAQIPKRTWTYKGHKVSLLTASCPSGSLFAHGEFDFADGTKISGNIIRPCSGT
jgi:hypothetical protein